MTAIQTARIAIYEVYQDLDGCLCDFDKGVTLAFNGLHPKRDLNLRDGQMWKRIANTPDFFANLEWHDNAKDFWDFIKLTNPTILTGIPLGNWAAPQKREWCARELGRHVPVITCMSRDKQNWSAPGRLLLDDREKNCLEWEAKGGHAILWKSPEQAMADLKAKFDLSSWGL